MPKTLKKITGGNKLKGTQNARGAVPKTEKNGGSGIGEPLKNAFGASIKAGKEGLCWGVRKKKVGWEETY